MQFEHDVKAARFPQTSQSGSALTKGRGGGADADDEGAAKSEVAAGGGGSSSADEDEWQTAESLAERAGSSLVLGVVSAWFVDMGVHFRVDLGAAELGERGRGSEKSRNEQTVSDCWYLKKVMSPCDEDRPKRHIFSRVRSNGHLLLPQFIVHASSISYHDSPPLGGGSGHKT